MEGLTTVPARVPAALWESLQEMCWRQDNRFIEDAARILGLPALDIKRRILGTRGVVCGVVERTGGVYDGTRCPIMVLRPGERWERCEETAETNGFCWHHRKGKGQRYDSHYFDDFEKRHAFMFEGEVVWVSEADGSILTGGGKILKDVTIDIVNAIAHDRRSAPETKEIKTKSEENTAEEEDPCSDSARNSDSPFDD
jgi:hypothetical protein